MLTEKASLIAVLTRVYSGEEVLDSGNRADRRGYVSTARVKVRVDIMVIEACSIAATWICTKSFWFLRPTD